MRRFPIRVHCNKTQTVVDGISHLYMEVKP